MSDRITLVQEGAPPKTVFAWDERSIKRYEALGYAVEGKKTKKAKSAPDTEES